MSSGSHEYTPIGDLIRHYRQEAKLTVTELAKLANVYKGNISKIEHGDVKKPDYNMVLSLSNVLHIPYTEIAVSYSEIEKKPESLLAILMETIQTGNELVITQVADKFLNSYGESEDLIAQLHSHTHQIEDTPIQLALYKVIIEYSRNHGIMPYIAKGLYEEYIIERNDFTKLTATYYSGRAVLHYANFLSERERLRLYYALAVHAFSLMKYDEAIDLSKYVIENDTAKGEYRVHAVYTICCAYYYLDKYEICQTYLEEYRKFPYDYIDDNVKLMIGLISGRTGDFYLGIKQLEHYLESPSSYNLIYSVTALFDFYMNINDLESAGKLRRYEEQMELSLQDIRTTPEKRAELALYYELNGHHQLSNNDFKDAIQYFRKSITQYMGVAKYRKAFYIVSVLIKLIVNKINDSSFLENYCIQDISELCENLSLKMIEEGDWR
ncbi:helix-turn-helix domain-containing protein [Paenibacillus sp. 481]|uniref:helix-turn-helix domain-containing protein n=1 Tax=Paenibacillus sp. 481 TaxID=2835869 RepID=UPI001E4B2864|nr:helix-turn-helix transcriptional regulator [Paenibacillus sp. 481]UHA75606.1 helix-turn-helix transcriptional regulator [Paenibacillus sp. 481]